MKRILRVSSFLLAAVTACCFGGCAGGRIKTENVIPTEKLDGSTLYVDRVLNMPDDFILGMDASSVIAEEQSGVKYYNYDHEEQDVFKTLAQAGVNAIRVRVWNDPYDENGNGFGGGNCDIEKAIETGKRATKYGMGLIVDFHLSDFWADPGKQMAPRAWQDMTPEEKPEAAYQYVKDCLKRLKKAGVKVTMVQIGNETNGALAGEKIWFNIQYIMAAGSKACREVLPDALVALHFANPEKEGSYLNYASKLAYYNIDYDVFASSYYPYWHGTLSNLAAVLDEIAVKYNKKVMVMETSYAYTDEDTDFNGNTVSSGGSIAKLYPFTVQGQANSVRDVTDTVVNRMTNGIGVVYWEGTWITVGTDSWEQNHELWEKFGSGWATSYAAGYDPDDAGKYYGGCAVDNQAMFDKYGVPLESLRVFNLMRWGNYPEPVPDAIEDVTLYVDLNSPIPMPEKVNAIFTDNSRSPVAVEWEITDDELAAMSAGGPNEYAVYGKAGGLDAVCYINMIAFNYLDNYSFESGELAPWTLTDRGGADELYVENKVTDSLTGDWHMHFWSAGTNTVDFSLEQQVDSLPAGSYVYKVSIMGGDCGETDIYAYVLVDGVEVGRAPMGITGYGNWDTAVITGIAVAEGQVVTVGVSVKCEGEGSGAWGKIDDAMLNSEFAG